MSVATETKRKPISLVALQKKRADEDKKLRAMLAGIEIEQSELAERAQRIRDMLGEGVAAGAAPEAPQANGAAVQFQCFDCDAKLPVGVVEMPKECPYCKVSPFEHRS